MPTKDLVKRSIQMIGSGSKQFVSDTFVNLESLKNDAVAIRQTVMKSVGDSKDTYRKIRSGSLYKSVLNWFEESDDYSGSDDEFDSGNTSNPFDTDDEDTSQPNVLTPDMMADISDKQNSTMYKIANKQAEIGIMNTAEIVNSFSQRSSEIIASVNDVNKSITALTSAFTEFTKNYAVAEEKKFMFENERNVTDSSGGLEVTKIIAAATNSLKETSGTVTQLIRTFAGNGPKDLISNMLSMAFDKVKIKNKSLSEIMNSFDDYIGAAVQNGLSNLLESKSFQRIFGTLNRGNADTNYGQYVSNKYDTKPALWDGMSRMTLINVIPDLLRTIHKDLSGQVLNINDRGDLTDKQEDYFRKVTKASYRGTLNSNNISTLTTAAQSYDTGITTTTMSQVTNALSMTYVMYLHQEGKMNLAANAVTYDEGIFNTTIQTLVYSSGKSAEYWSPILMGVIQKISSDTRMKAQFIQGVNKNLNSMISDATNFATSSIHNKQARKININMAREEFKEQYQPASNNTSKNNNQNDNLTGIINDISNNNKRGSNVNSGANLNTFKASDYSMYDYVGNIFGILNRGINVHVTGKTPYKKYSPKHVNEKNANASLNQFTISEESTIIRTGKQEDSDKSAYQKMLDKLLPSDDGGSNDQLRDSINGLINPIAGIGNKILGTKTKNDEGKTVRQGGIVGNVKDKVSNELNNIKSDLSSIFNNFANKADMSSAKRAINRSVSSGELSAEDQLKAQNVYAMMQTSVSDRDTTEDASAISSVINSISDNKLRSRLQASILPMLTRSDNKKSDEGGTKYKSLAGTIFSKFASGAKLIFSPIISLVTAGFKLIKTLGSKIFGLIKKGFGAGVRNITTGTSNVVRGLFGQKAKYDDEGNEIRSASSGVFGAAANALKNNRTPETTQTPSNTSTVATNTTTSSNSTATSATDTTSTKTKLFSNPLLKDFKGDFMQGFSSAAKESSAKKEKARVKSLKTETVADRESENIANILSGKTKESILTKILNKIDDVLDYTKQISENKSGGTIFDNSSSSSSGTTDGTTNDTDTAAATAANVVSAKSSNKTKTSSASSESGGKKGALFGIGQALGGITSMLGGIFQIVMTAVISLEGFKVLQEFLTNTLNAILSPLSDMFIMIKEAITPIIMNISSVLKTVVVFVTEIVDAVVDIIAPILEALQPVINSLLEVLQPILDLITSLIEVIMAPLMGIMQAVVVPLLRQVGNTLEIIGGIIQTVAGYILTALGGILGAIGTIISFVSLGAAGNGLKERGSEMADMGTTMMSSGISSVVSGTKKLVTTALTQLNPVAMTSNFYSSTLDNLDNTDDETDTSTKTSTEYNGTGGSVMDGVINNNTSNTTTNNTTTNVYGSGNSPNQLSYGNSLNMSERGCGPSALSDVIARKSGSTISPYVLASKMAASGSYEPNRGTSVAGFINTSRAAGINLIPGGVTRSSLKQATPSNPITLVGSGSEFGTKSGNNHYVNVIGSNSKSGQAYVVNSLTGNVERRSLTELVNNSKLGLYGSGDSTSNTTFKFDDDVTSALTNLANLTSGLFSMFDTSTSTTDTINAAIDKAATDEATTQAKLTLGDDYDEEKYKEAAMNYLKIDYPQKDGESDSAYETRTNKLFTENESKYMAMAVAGDEKGASAILNSYKDTSNTSSILGGLSSTSTKLFGEYDAESGGYTGGWLGSLNDSINEGSTSVVNSDKAGSFVSDGGAIMATSKYTPTIFKTNITGSVSGESPVHEFFKKTSGEDAATSGNYNWFKLRNTPDNEGQGTTGDTHKGVDINTPNDSTQDIPLYAITDGVVTTSTYSNSAGNFVAWTDHAGYKHRYLHMKRTPFVGTGSTLVGGETLIGYIGNTGDSDGAHLHYDIMSPMGAMVNPMTYFKYVEPTTTDASGSSTIDGVNKIDIPEGLTEDDYWCKAYKENANLPTYIKSARAAGMSWSQLATVLGVGIAENSARKLFGEESVTNVVFNSQGGHAGLMNWQASSSADVSSTYGSTTSDQLKYIYNRYFSPTADASPEKRATVYSTADKYEVPYTEATGRTFALNVGDRYGDYISKDLIEGATHYVGSAVVPNSNGINTKAVMNHYIGTAAEAYNWMLDQGYPSKSEYASGDIASSIVIPPLDNDTVYNDTIESLSNSANNIQTTSTNNTPDLEITPISSLTDSNVRQILQNTYQVRAKELETMMSKIIEILVWIKILLEEMKKEGKTKTTGTSTLTDKSQLFDNNSIPDAVVRLSS